MRWAGHVVGMGEMINAYNILVEKPDGKRPIGRREDNIRMDLRGICWESEDWMHLALDRFQ
jgi:hypothetical protein